jgi:hypothetical protein
MVFDVGGAGGSLGMGRLYVGYMPRIHVPVALRNSSASAAVMSMTNTPACVGFVGRDGTA